MMKLNIEQASLHLGIAQASLRRKLKTGEVSGIREPYAGGFRWMVNISEDAPPIEEAEDAALVAELKARVNNLEEQLTIRAGEIDQLHRLLAQTALNAAPVRPWWRFWG